MTFSELHIYMYKNTFALHGVDIKHFLDKKYIK